MQGYFLGFMEDRPTSEWYYYQTFSRTNLNTQNLLLREWTVMVGILPLC